MKFTNSGSPSSPKKRKVVQRLRVRTKRVLGNSAMNPPSESEREVKKLISAAITNKDIEIDVEEVRNWPREGINDAFNIAVEHGCVKLVRDLGNFVSKPAFGDALIRCSRCGHEDVANCLLDMNAYLDYRKDDQTPLISAVKHEQQSMVKYLLSKKADIFTVDGHHNTILHIAAKMGDRGICKLALENGTLPHVLNEEEKTPIELAKTEDVARTILTTYLNKMRGNGEIIDLFGAGNAIDPLRNPFSVTLEEGSRLGELFWSGIYNLSIYRQRCLSANYDLYPFDRLQKREKTVVLYQVAEAFGTPDMPISWNLLHECGLYAIFEMIFGFVNSEIQLDSDGTTFKWRTKVIYAFEEVYNLDSADFGLSEKCRTVEVWRPLIELILYVFFGQSFWDKKRLFKCKNVLERRREFILKYNVSENYFRSQLPDKTVQTLAATQAQIGRVMEMCHQKLTLNLKHVKWNRCCRCLNCFLNSTPEFLQSDYTPRCTKVALQSRDYQDRYLSLQNLRLRSQNELSKFWNSISTEKWTMTEITIEELEEIICYTADWETLRAALESYTKYAWDSDLLEIQDNLVTIADDMSDARGMEELLAEVLEAVTQPVTPEERRGGVAEFVVDIQHLREVVGLGNVYDSLQQLGKTNQRNQQNDIWERYGRQMLENLVLCEFARKVAQEYVRQRDESHARAAALELELQLIAEEEAQQKTKKRKKKKKKKRKKNSSDSSHVAEKEKEKTEEPVKPPVVVKQVENAKEPTKAPPKQVEKVTSRKKEEISSEYNDSNPFAMLNGLQKNTKPPVTVTEPTTKKKKKKRRGKKKKKKEEEPPVTAGDNTSPSLNGDAETDSTVSAISLSEDIPPTTITTTTTTTFVSDSRPQKRKRSNTHLKMSPIHQSIPTNMVPPIVPHSPASKQAPFLTSRPPKTSPATSPISPGSTVKLKAPLQGPDKKKQKTRLIMKNEKNGRVPPRPNPWAWVTKYVDGMMFVCNNETYDECLKIKLLGLPRQYLKNVQCLKAEQSALFLFNMSTRLLYGVFEPTESGGENLNRTAWNRSTDTRSGSRYPAQVPFQSVFDFPPLPEPIFRHMFSDGNRIRKLNAEQVSEILKLFIQQYAKRNNGKKKTSAPVLLATSGPKSNPWKTKTSKSMHKKSKSAHPHKPPPSPQLATLVHDTERSQASRSQTSSPGRATSSPGRTHSEESKEESEPPRRFQPFSSVIPDKAKDLINSFSGDAMRNAISQSPELLEDDRGLANAMSDSRELYGEMSNLLGTQEMKSSSFLQYTHTPDLIDSTQGLIGNSDRLKNVLPNDLFGNDDDTSAKFGDVQGAESTDKSSELRVSDFPKDLFLLGDGWSKTGGNIWSKGNQVTNNPWSNDGRPAW